MRSALASAESASRRSDSSIFFISRISDTASFSLFHFVSRTEVFCLSSPISCSISLRRDFIFVLCSDISSSFLSASRSISRRRTARSAITSSSGLFSSEMRSADAASSMRSTALSGRKRSVMYRLERFTAETIASSVIRTPWYISYFSATPRRMAIASSIEGSVT